MADQKSTIEISFIDGTFPPVTLPSEAPIAEYLTVCNSPILFGCRTGICGTCLVSVHGENVELSPATEDELEVLDTIVPDCKGLRLACQLKLRSNALIKSEDQE